MSDNLATFSPISEEDNAHAYGAGADIVSQMGGTQACVLLVIVVIADLEAENNEGRLF